MELISILGIVLFGLLLIVAEIFLFPGITIAGAIGVLIVMAGLILAYAYQPASTAHWILAGTMLSSGFLLYLGFKVYKDQRFALKDVISGHVNPDATVKPGDKGMTIGPLKPSGKALFGEDYLEVHSLQDFISENTPVSVQKVERNKIFVVPDHN